MATGATLQGTLPVKAGPRTFWVRVPVDYDPSHHYRVQYVGQGCGGYEVADVGSLNGTYVDHKRVDTAAYLVFGSPDYQVQR